jgi:hypothetical protein
MFRDAKTWIVGVLVLALVSTQCLGQVNSWKKIRYIGGTVRVNVDPYDWNTTLTVTADSVVVDFAHRQTLKIPPSHVTALSYGQEAHRRVADMVAISLLVNPVALFGLLHQSKDHFIAIEYTGDDTKPASLLFEADKDNYKTVLRALKNATGKPVQGDPEP